MRSCTHSKGLPALDLGKQEACPACVARAQPRTARTRWGWVARAGASAHPARWGAGRGFRPHGFRRRRPGKGLPPHNSQRFCSTFVLCLATQGRESMARLDRTEIRPCARPSRLWRAACDHPSAATPAGALRSRPGTCGSRSRPGSAPAGEPRSPCDRCRSRPPCRAHGRGRARRAARRSRPAATRGQGSAPAACRVKCGNGGSFTSWPGDPLIIFADVGVGLEVAGEGRAERDDRADLLRTTMRQLPGEHPAEAPADQQAPCAGRLISSSRAREAPSCRPWPRYSGPEAKGAPASPRGRAHGEGPSSCDRWRESRG